MSSGLMQGETCLSNLPADFTDGSQCCHKAQKEESSLFLYRDANTKHNLDLRLKAVTNLFTNKSSKSYSFSLIFLTSK